MAHAKINLQRMLGWIEDCIDDGSASPTDHEICDLFGFDSTEQARTLLAELTDQGKISIDWKAEPRVITLGPKTPSALQPERPLAGKVVRRDEDGKPIQVHPATVLASPHHIHVAQERNRVAADQPSRVDQIRAAAERLKNRQSAQAPAVPAAPAAAPVSAPAPAAPGKGMGRGYRVPKVATRADRRQLNVHFASHRFAEVERLADAAGMSPSEWARNIVMAALDGAEPQFRRGHKPRISAEVIRAAANAGEPLDAFVTTLIDRGLAAYEARA